MNLERIHAPTNIIFRLALAICLVLLLSAYAVHSARSQTYCTPDNSPDASLASNKSASSRENVANDISPEISHTQLVAVQADPHADPESAVNWAWLALPAVLGMLIITLGRPEGR